MATTTVFKNQVSMMLNIGSSPATGEIVTKAVSIGTLSDDVSDYDDDKAIACASAISRCLSNTLYRVRKVASSYISAS